MTFDTKTARYVKFQGVKRSTVFGYSIYEFEVYAPDHIQEYKRLIGLMEQLLPRLKKPERLRELLLLVLNRYPYDATRDLRPIQDLLQRAQMQ